jgi:hypothetical protein
MDHPDGVVSGRCDRKYFHRSMRLELWNIQISWQKNCADEYTVKNNFAFHWMGLSCRWLRNYEAQLQLNALAYNWANFLHYIAPSDVVIGSPLVHLQQRLIKNKTCVILSAFHRLRGLSLCV